MKSGAVLFRLETLVLVLAAAAALPPLVEAWRYAPLEKWSAVSFAVWLAPWFWKMTRVVFVRPGASAAEREAAGAAPASRFQNLWLWAATLGLLAGLVADLNVMLHVALAAALAAWVPRWNAAWSFWLVCAAAWLPATGWLLAGTGPADFMALLRAGVAAIGAGVVFAGAVRGSSSRTGSPA